MSPKPSDNELSGAPRINPTIAENSDGASDMLPSARRGEKVKGIGGGNAEVLDGGGGDADAGGGGDGGAGDSGGGGTRGMEEKDVACEHWMMRKSVYCWNDIREVLTWPPDVPMRL